MTLSHSSCDCTHDQEAHDSASGACQSMKPIFGACPCAATPESVRTAQEYVVKTTLGPEYKRLQKQASDAREATQRVQDASTELLAKLLFGSDDEVAQLRADARRFPLAQEMAR